MTNNDELALKLKQAAESATKGNWRRTSTEFNGICVRPFSFTKEEVLARAVEKRDAIFIAAANPANIIAMLAERDADKKRIADLEIKIQRQKDKLQRMASKTITIGLKPMRIEGGAYCSAHAYYDKNGEYLSLDDVEKKCAAAGIKLEVGE